MPTTLSIAKDKQQSIKALIESFALQESLSAASPSNRFTEGHCAEFACGLLRFLKDKDIIASLFVLERYEVDDDDNEYGEEVSHVAVSLDNTCYDISGIFDEMNWRSSFGEMANEKHSLYNAWGESLMSEHEFSNHIKDHVISFEETEIERIRHCFHQVERLNR